MTPSKFCSFSSFRTVGVLAVMTVLLSQVIELECHVTNRDDDDTAVNIRSSSRSSSSSGLDSSATSGCQPVTNDMLWVRLNLHTKPVGTWTPRPDRREPRSTPAVSKRRSHSKPRRGRRHVDGESRDLESGSLPILEPHAGSSNSSTASPLPKRKRPDLSLRRHQKHRQKKIQNPKRNSSSSGLLDPTSMLRSTSWQCRMEQQWEKMEDGTFPPYLQTGKCRQTKCMEGLYECTTKRYSVKVLKRIPNACYPLPVLGRNSSFEEAWTFANYNVVVGCECTRKREGGTYYSSHSPSAELGDNS